MKYEIDDAIIKTATKCEKNHACLADAIPLCPVELCLMMRGIYYVKCLHDEPCPYKNIMDKATICTCPVRKEIFNRCGV